MVQTANRIAQHPGGTLPAKLQNPAALDSLYRLAEAEAVTHEAVLEPHRQLTWQRMRDCDDVVLIIQDTTMLDDTTIGSLRDELGIIGKGRTIAAISATTAWRSPPRRGRSWAWPIRSCSAGQEAPPGESRAQRRSPSGPREPAVDAGQPGPARRPRGEALGGGCDRGADIFEYLDQKHLHGGHYLVRSSHNRWVQIVGDDGPPRRHKQHDYARGLPARGCKTVVVPRRGRQPARTAKLVLSAAAVTLIPPRRKRGEHRREVLPSCVVVAREIDAPEGVEPMRWILLTDLEVADLEDIVRLLHWYGGRWTVEDYHKALKTGCGVETLRLTTASRLRPVLALLSVVAVSLRQLRDAGRAPEADVRPATELASAVAVLAGWRYGVPRRDLTLRE